MNKFYPIIAALIFSGLFLFSCKSDNPQQELVASGKKISDPITYEVVIKNPNPDDDWLEECLANTHTEEFVSDILAAVKNETLPAFDYYDNHQLTTNEIESIISENSLEDRVGKIQFEEDWYWDKDQLQLKKEVKKIMFGYEIYDSQGKLRGYKASFVVNLSQK